MRTTALTCPPFATLDDDSVPSSSTSQLVHITPEVASLSPALELRSLASVAAAISITKNNASIIMKRTPIKIKILRLAELSALFQQGSMSLLVIDPLIEGSSLRIIDDSITYD